MSMSTTCMIGIIQKDQTVKSIYCHNDGNIEGVGQTLYDHYFDREKIEALLQLGSISVLERKLYPSDEGSHSFICPEKDVTIAYMRDRGEKNQQARQFKNIEDFSVYYTRNMCDYAYLYDENKQQWKYCEGYMNGEESLQILQTAIEGLYINKQNQEIKLC